MSLYTSVYFFFEEISGKQALSPDLIGFQVFSRIGRSLVNKIEGKYTVALLQRLVLCIYQFVFPVQHLERAVEKLGAYFPCHPGSTAAVQETALALKSKGVAALIKIMNIRNVPFPGRDHGKFPGTDHAPGIIGEYLVHGMHFLREITGHQFWNTVGGGFGIKQYPERFAAETIFDLFFLGVQPFHDIGFGNTACRCVTGFTGITGRAEQQGEYGDEICGLQSVKAFAGISNIRFQREKST